MHCKVYDISLSLKINKELLKEETIMISLIGGIIAALLGLFFLAQWFEFFLLLLKATVPVLFILGGGLAAYLGYEEIKDKTVSDSSDDENMELKNQVETLKEELRELKSEKEKTGDGDTE